MTPAPRPPYATDDPDRFIGKGHPAGDFLEAFEWIVTDEAPDTITITAHLPEWVLNPRRQLFGGFTGTYVDLVVLYTVRAGPGRTDPTMPRDWLTTTSMHIDYLAPITGPTFVIQSEVEHRGSRTRLVRTRFFQGDKLAVVASTTVLEIADPGSRTNDL